MTLALIGRCMSFCIVVFSSEALAGLGTAVWMAIVLAVGLISGVTLSIAVARAALGWLRGRKPMVVFTVVLRLGLLGVRNIVLRLASVVIRSMLRVGLMTRFGLFDWMAMIVVRGVASLALLWVWDVRLMVTWVCLVLFLVVDRVWCVPLWVVVAFMFCCSTLLDWAVVRRVRLSEVSVVFSEVRVVVSVRRRRMGLSCVSIRFGCMWLLVLISIRTTPLFRGNDRVTSLCVVTALASVTLKASGWCIMVMNLIVSGVVAWDVLEFGVLGSRVGVVPISMVRMVSVTRTMAVSDWGFAEETRCMNRSLPERSSHRWFWSVTESIPRRGPHAMVVCRRNWGRLYDFLCRTVVSAVMVWLMLLGLPNSGVKLKCSRLGVWKLLTMLWLTSVRTMVQVRGRCRSIRDLCRVGLLGSVSIILG